MADNKPRRRLVWNDVILGAIGIAGFATFVVALEFSIASIPFGIIVAVVLVMALADYYQSIWKDGDE